MVGGLRGHHLVLVLGSLAAAGCSSSGDGEPVVSTTSIATTTTTTTTPATTAPPPSPSAAECRRRAGEAAAPLQAFIDEYDILTVDEWNALDPPPDVEPAQTSMIDAAQAAVDDGCDPELVEAAMQTAIAALRGDSSVGRAIAAALRGDGPILGPPGPIPTTTVSVETEPRTVTVDPGDDLAGALVVLAPGSTVEFAAGTHEFDRPIVVDRTLTLVGQGRDETIIRSSAPGAAVSFIGPGALDVRDLTIEHTGSEPASVLLAIEGPVTVSRAAVRGGVAEVEGGGGHGIAFAFENVDGLPERTAAERAGDLRIDDTIVTDNEVAGVLVSGDAAPTIVSSTVRGNGSCGVCFTAESGGTVTETFFDANLVGVRTSDDSSPLLDDVEIVNSTGGVGLLIEGASSTRVVDGRVSGNGAIGVQVVGSATPEFVRTAVSDHDVGVLVTGTAAPTVDAGALRDHGIAIQAGDRAVVAVADTIVAGASDAAIVYGDSSSGSVRGNSISSSTGLGIQLAGSAQVTVSQNTISGRGGAGVSLIGSASGTIADNQIDDRTVGVQLDDSVTAEILRNTVAGEVGIGLSGLASSGGTIADNLLTGRQIGVQLGGTSSPSVTGNQIIDSTSVGILVEDSSAADVAGNRISGTETIGIQVAGSAAPDLRDNLIEGAGDAGIGYLASAGGVARGNEVRGRSIGLQVGGTASPDLTANTVVDSGTVGILIEEQSDAVVVGNSVSSADSIGVLVRGSARPRLQDNDITDGSVGLLVRDDAAGSVVDNTVTRATIGIQAIDRAAPVIDGNRIADNTDAAIVYGGSASGRFVGNTVVHTGAVGLQIGDDAAPAIESNEIRGPGPTGIIYREQAAGTMLDNRIIEFEVGIQLIDDSTPDITDNTFEEIDQTSILYGGSSGGTASGNDCPSVAGAGISVTAPADPELSGNSCSLTRSG